MARRRWLLVGMALLVCALVVEAHAQAPAAPAPNPGDWPANLDLLTRYAKTPATFERGPGFYIGPIKLLLCWLAFLGWVVAADWVNQDSQRLEGKYLRWNSILVGSFVAALAVVWLLDSSIWLTLPILLGSWGGALGYYIWRRNAGVEPHQKVLTPDHLRFWLAPRLQRFGVKIATEAPKKKKEQGPPIELKATCAKTPAENQAVAIKTKTLPGFVAAAELVIDARKQRVSQVQLDYSREGVAVRYQIDSVWSDRAGRDRASADPMLEALKTICGLKPEERVKRQRGIFEAVYDNQKFRLSVTSQGTKTGERATLRVVDNTAHKARLQDLGMSEAEIEKLKRVLLEKRGLVLVSAPPGGGLTSLVSATVAGVDRYMRSAMALEEAGSHEMQVENVPARTYDAAAGQTPEAVLVDIIRQYPDVIVVPETSDGKIVTTLCEQVEEDRLVIAGLRARETADALLRPLMLKVPIKQVAKTVTAVVNQRLVRKLCDDCKQVHELSPQLVQQLKLTSEEAACVRRPPPLPKPDEKKPKECKTCGNIGYLGVTGLVELMIVDDSIRAALANLPKVDAAKHVAYLRQTAQKAGMRTLQEAGIALVARGVTSIQELQRALSEKD